MKKLLALMCGNYAPVGNIVGEKERNVVCIHVCKAKEVE